MLQRVDNNARAFIVDFVQHTHSMSLASACLPVNEESAIVTVKYVVH